MRKLIQMLAFLTIAVVIVNGSINGSGFGLLRKNEDASITDHACRQCDCTMLVADCSNRSLTTVPLDLPSRIKTLKLNKNHIHTLPDNLLGSHYKNLQTLDITDNPLLLDMNASTFQGLAELHNLYIGGDEYATVDTLIFKPLKKIQIIVVNGIGKSFSKTGFWETWLKAFKGLQNSTIEKITYDSITLIPFTLEKRYFKYFENCHLKELYLPNNRISAMETGLLNFLPELEILDLSRNMIATVIPKSGLNFGFQLLKMVHLRVLRIDASERRVFQDLNAHNEIKCGDIEWPLPLGLEELNLSWNTLDIKTASIPCVFKIQRNNKLKVFNAANTHLVTYFGGPLEGLIHLQEFIYDNNDCKIEPEFFTCASGYFESLKVLQLAHNRVMLSKPNSNYSLFTNCSKLVHLDISYNGLMDVPSDMLNHTSSVEIINLSGNKLVNINIDLNTPASLKVLNLSQNYIRRLDESMRNNINTVGKRNNIILDLNGNPLLCNCDSLEFIKWVKDHLGIIYQGSNLTCQYINGSNIQFLNLELSYMKFECLKSAIIASGISVGFVLLIVGVVVFVYKRRYKIIYVVLHLRALLRRNKLADIVYDFDGFLSYSSLDKTWAITKIYGQLAAQYGYNICVDDRNFRPGSYLSDIIVESISKSNKIILVISENFLRSGWCKFEMNLARGELATRGRDCLILILKEPREFLPPELITPTLRSLLETRVYLEWSNEEDRKLLFWRRLRDALGEPRFRGDEDTPYLYQNNDGDDELLRHLI